MLLYHDKYRAVDIIYLDFQKEFDSVPHKCSMVKVRALDIRENIAGWIENWLKNRRQRVVINEESSEWVYVNSGVSQGSVLGHFYSLYINDLYWALSTNLPSLLMTPRFETGLIQRNM